MIFMAHANALGVPSGQGAVLQQKAVYFAEGLELRAQRLHAVAQQMQRIESRRRRYKSKYSKMKLAP